MSEGSNDSPARYEPDISSEEVPDSEAVRELVRREIAYYQGPLPDPITLREYENTLPGLADRIVTRMEQESNHRHATERRGQYIAAGIAGWGLICGPGLVLLGNAWAGVAIARACIVPQVYAFLRSGQRALQRSENGNNP